jgi:hypothetical protein
VRCQDSGVTADSLIRTIEGFLAESHAAMVLEDGAATFDLAESKYAVSGEHNKCLLHLWSAERNVVRRVVDAEVHSDRLRLAVQKLGQSRPSKLEICRERDPRTPTAKKAARAAYLRRLTAVLERSFSGYKLVRLSNAVDLEKSFGPIYSRGLLRRGQTAFAVLGVNAQETQASIDAALTFGVLWLNACRQRESNRAVVEGLKLFLPAGTSRLSRERMAHLNPHAAKWQLYELDERENGLKELDCADRGNVATRLVHCPDESAARQRFAEAVAWVRRIMPEVEFAVLSSAEIAFRRHGLEFARARIKTAPGEFSATEEIVFGVGAEETVLTQENAGRFADLVRNIGEVRHPDGPKDHFLWRLHPERWLESLVMQDLGSLGEQLDPSLLYSQVPAFSASDRAMIDVLATTRSHRLTVVELKADEDIHLPLQGLDYWARVAWHHARGEFQRFGYFPGRELAQEEPLLLLVAPALHVHPATDTLLHYLSPKIDCTLLGIDERWRKQVRIVFRKRPFDTAARMA